VKPVAAVVALLAFGWALVAAADARHEAKPAEVRTAILRLDSPVPVVEVDTPYADSLVDWVAVERETECLWVLLQREGVELTFENVWAAGVWSDAVGGACRMIGEDDE
jgi:hypothetical protein